MQWQQESAQNTALPSHCVQPKANWPKVPNGSSEYMNTIAQNAKMTIKKGII